VSPLRGKRVSIRVVRRRYIAAPGRSEHGVADCSNANSRSQGPLALSRLEKESPPRTGLRFVALSASSVALSGPRPHAKLLRLVKPRALRDVSHAAPATRAAQEPALDVLNEILRPLSSTPVHASAGSR
jgi:hypothetical protein